MFFSRAIVPFLLIAGALLKEAEVRAADVTLSPQASIGLSLEPTKAFVIKDIKPGSPSANSGVQQGTTLLSLNRKKVNSTENLGATMSSINPGQRIEVTFVEYNTEQQIYKLHKVMVEASALPVPTASKQATLNLTLGETTLFAVKDLATDSPSAEAGMRKGDLLLSLNKYKIDSATDIRTAMLTVEPGQAVEVEFVDYNAEQLSYELHKASVKTSVRPGRDAVTPPGTLTLADLGRHPERWPATVTVEKEVTLPNGETVPAGQQFRVSDLEDTGEHVSLKGSKQNFLVETQSTNFLQTANEAWATLTPSQKAIDLQTIVEDASLWPVQVTVLNPLKSTTNVDVNAGEKIGLNSFLPNGRLWLYSVKTNTVVATLAETDFVAQARKRALLTPEERSSRVPDALREALVDAKGQPYKNAQLDDSRIFVFYYGASWCVPCRQFAPSLVQYINLVKPKNPRFSVVFLDGDKGPEQMQAYMQQEQMPWPAIRMNAPNMPAIVSTYFKDTLPQLVIIDRQGNLLADSHDKGLDGTVQVLTNLLDASVAQ